MTFFFFRYCLQLLLLFHYVIAVVVSPARSLTHRVVQGARLTKYRRVSLSLVRTTGNRSRETFRVRLAGIAVKTIYV